MRETQQISSLDETFTALASPARRRMIDLVCECPGMTVSAVASHFEMSRIGVMKHLTQLERAGLLLSEKVGRERRLYFNPLPIQEIYDRWTNQYSAFWSGRMADIKQRVEERALAEENKSA